MQITLALLAIATSTLLLGWIGLRDAKRLRVAGRRICLAPRLHHGST